MAMIFFPLGLRDPVFILGIGTLQPSYCQVSPTNRLRGSEAPQQSAWGVV